MNVDVLRKLLLRDLAAVADQVRLYENEADLWKQTDAVRNAGGNLALHICGNLQHFIGATLGGSGYVRDREAEFSRRDVPRAELLAEVERAVASVGAAFDRITEETLDAPYPLEIGAVKLSARMFLSHLCVHLGYHLGQLDYHRRFVTGGAASGSALSPKALAE